MYNFVYADGKDKPYPNITSSLKKYAEVKITHKLYFTAYI